MECVCFVLCVLILRALLLYPLLVTFCKTYSVLVDQLWPEIYRNLAKTGIAIKLALT